MTVVKWLSVRNYQFAFIPSWVYIQPLPFEKVLVT